MTTQIIHGNIVDSTDDIIVHQVNCQFVMGSGVAKALRDKFNNLYDSYIKCKDQDIINKYGTRYYLGMAQIVPVIIDENHDVQFVCNLFGQDKYGYDGKQYTDYDAIECGLNSLKRELMFGSLRWVSAISFPWNMGAARGGGDWNTIKAMIERIFSSTNINIHYYQLT